MTKRAGIRANAAITAAQAVSSEAQASGETKGLTLRLDRGRWRALRQLALDREVSVHSILLDAVDRELADAKAAGPADRP